MNSLARPSLIEIAPQASRPSALPDHIYAILKQKILTCALPPDQRLIEKKLCEELGVSRTPLREALNRLSHEELVSFQPHIGYRVASITLQGFRNLIELRTVLEPQATALAALRATPEEIAKMRSCAVLNVDPNDETGFVEFCRANSLFHLCVVRCARNPLLENIVMSCLDMYQRPTYMRIGRQMDPSNPSQKHMNIVDAIEARDPQRAQAAMYDHVRGGGERIMEALKAANFK